MQEKPANKSKKKQRANKKKVFFGFLFQIHDVLMTIIAKNK
uniref:Uncharacterized protein n=1 Tax=Rhizophora mucronata TaxID=61149 RepID=A0A2P2NF02_RHIMU